jgi:small subunit ribosomal protein S1
MAALLILFSQSLKPMSADTQAPESAGQPTDSNSSTEPPATESLKTESVSAESTTTSETAVGSEDVVGSEDAVGSENVGSENVVGSESVVGSENVAETSDHRPSERIQIGTQRDDDTADTAEAKPVNPGSSTPAEPEPTKSNYPPPNVRDQLSPELEKELEAALGGESLDAIIDDSAATAGATDELQPDTKVTGTVAKIHREDIFIELGGRNQGLLPLKQFEKSEPPEVGSQLEVTVARFNPEQGLYEVSLPTAAVTVGNWDDVELGQIIDVSITGHNKGGLECQVSGIRGFIPMGQISIYRVENAEEYVGQKLTCVITEANRAKKNLVLSHRALMERERKEQRAQLLEELAPGQIREGTVRSLQDFGAFVDLGGIDGLIHVSQLSWERVNHPRDVLQEGQAVKVRIEKVDKENGKIGLAYRDLADNPWDSVPSKYGVGSTVKGTVSKLMQFGAFVRLEAGVEGLIHISEMGHGRVNKAGDVVSEGQEVEVKVLSVDTDAQRIGLSLKALMARPDKPGRESKQKGGDIPAPENIQRREKESDKNLKGGISSPSGGEKFGLKW